jgi:hypothetical protein
MDYIMKATKLIVEEFRIYVDPMSTPLRNFLYLAEVAEAARVREYNKRSK